MKKEVVPGIHGPIGFKGINTIDAKYSFIQACKTNSIRVIGSYNNGITNIDFSNVNFYPTNDIPISRVVPLRMSFESVGGICLSVLSSILLAATLMLIIIIWLYRKERPIKAASPLFCELILIGIALCCVSIIVSTVSPSYFLCNLRVWCLTFGFSLIIVNLLAKTYRIFKIFSNRRPSSSTIKDKHLFIFSGCIVIFDMAILCVFTFTNFAYEPRVIESSRTPYVSFVVCAHSNDTFSNIIYTFLIVTLIFSVFFLAILAFLTRKVDSKFNESFHIAITVYIYVIVLVIITPLYIISGELTNSQFARYYEINIGIFVMMAVTLIAIFFPKLRHLWRKYRPQRSDIASSEFATLTSPTIPGLNMGAYLGPDGYPPTSSNITEFSMPFNEHDSGSIQDADVSREALRRLAETRFITFNSWEK